MSRLSSLVAQVSADDPRTVAQIEQEIRDELAFHLEMRAEEFAAQGMPPADALAAAEERFGDFHRIYRCCRSALLGDRIMFQRLQTLTIAILLMAVVGIGYQSYVTQSANRLALAEMAAELTKLKAAGAQTSSTAAPAWEAERPRVVKTFPVDGAVDVDPASSEIRVTFNSEMADGCWSWVRSSPEAFPESTGDVHYQADMKTCVMPVQLEPGTKYVVWFNTANYQNFKDRDGRPAMPHMLSFTTRK